MLALAILAAWSAGAAALGQQQAAWYEGFEGPQPSWRLAGGNARYQLEFQQRIRGEAHGGEGCERLRISGTGGSEIYFGHDVGHPLIIPDLLPTLWIKADRPGIQLAAQVVLPATLDPRTRRPLSVLLHGSSYSTVGRWQQLRIEDLSRLLARQVRVLRTQYGPSVDPRDAYVDRLLLNVYGGPGVTNVWIDDLEIAGHVSREGVPAAQVAAAPWSPAAPSAPIGSPADRADNPAEPVREQIKVVDSVLLVNDRPIFPRALQYQGEPLPLVKQLGFNAIWVSSLPTTAMLEEAAQLGLRIISPPPCSPPPDSPDAGDIPVPEVGPAYDQVLAWDLGGGLESQHLPAVRRWAEQIRRLDRRQTGRPIVCRPESDLKHYSRIDLSGYLVLGRSPLGTSLELADYGVWLRERPQFLARGGTSIWSTIQTQPLDSARRQWAALGQSAVPDCFSSEQIQLLVYTAVIAGSRGLLFESRSPLTMPDPDTRMRALTLELVNRELDLVEPWGSAGNLIATVPGNEPGVIAAELQREHGQLLVPMWSVPHTQLVTGQSAGRKVSFKVPGVPATSDAYLILPGGLRPLRTKYVAGGLLVTLDEFGLAGLVLITNNPKTYQDVKQRADRVGRRWAELQCELANAKWKSVSQTIGQLAGRGPAGLDTAAHLAQAQKALEQSSALLAARNEAEACVNAQRAARTLRLLERAYWDPAVAKLDSPVASPQAVLFATLPGHWSLMARLSNSQPGANLLPAGDFEEPGEVFEVGWKHFQHTNPGIESGADLSPAAAHAGRLGLRLAARAAQVESASLPVESPPSWMTSPPVTVEAGTLVRIQGWVQIPKPLAGSVDGLLIVDSLGGEALAHRVRQTNGWQSFTLYRIAPQTGPVTVTFALTGLGEAWIDDVTIQPLMPK